MIELTGLKGNRLLFRADDIKVIEEHNEKGYVEVYTSNKKFKVKEFALDIKDEIELELDKANPLIELLRSQQQ